MKPLFTIICVTFFVASVTAQEDTDQATIRCYYRFSHKIKSNNKEIFVQDTLTLDIGPKMSRYYDERKIHQDSLFGSILSNVNMIKSISVLKNVNPDIFDNSLGDTYRNNSYDGISEQIYKDRKSGNITMLNLNSPESVSSGQFEGTDPVGSLDWIIIPDTAVFFNYPCQKASLHFRGRDYEAWFTSQIPINDGPWKFYGLPGLILKVKDAGDLFDFECIGLEYLDTPYSIKIPEHKYFKCNRKDYNKVMNRKRGGLIININDGNVTLANFNADTSVEPMELE